MSRPGTAEHACDECEARFPSRNQLLRHSLIVGHRYTLPALPVATRTSNGAGAHTVIHACTVCCLTRSDVPCALCVCRLPCAHCVFAEPLPALDRRPVELKGVERTAPHRFAPDKDHQPPPSPRADKAPSPPHTPAATVSFSSRQSPPLTVSPHQAGEPWRRNRLPVGRFSVAKTSRFMVLLSQLFKEGRVDRDDRGALKELLLVEDSVVFGAFEAHELEPDLDDLVDTLRRYLARRRSFANQQ